MNKGPKRHLPLSSLLSPVSLSSMGFSIRLRLSKVKLSWCCSDIGTLRRKSQPAIRGGLSDVFKRGSSGGPRHANMTRVSKRPPFYFHPRRSHYPPISPPSTILEPLRVSYKETDGPNESYCVPKVAQLLVSRFSCWPLRVQEPQPSIGSSTVSASSIIMRNAKIRLPNTCKRVFTPPG